jgi:ABC-2 type transport system ATP-binding protein
VEPRVTATTAVALRQVCFRYRRATVFAVDHLDFEVGTGQVVALLGPNGAGKSTAIYIILGLVPPTSGQVRLLGTEAGRAVAAGRVAAMFQENALLPRTTIRELLDFTATLYPSAMPVDEVLELTGLAALAGRGVEKLSGGQVQRTRLAMSLVGRPDLLILDEPTSALDVESRRDFWTTMRSYAAAGRSVLFSTHNLEEADENADRVILIARGACIADGSPEEIKRRVPGWTVSINLGGGDAASLEHLPGVLGVTVKAGRAYLSTTDSDATVLALAGSGLVRDLRVVGTNLEDAVLALTTANRAGEAPVGSHP